MKLLGEIQASIKKIPVNDCPLAAVEKERERGRNGIFLTSYASSRRNRRLEVIITKNPIWELRATSWLARSSSAQ